MKTLLIKRDRKHYFYHQILLWIALITLEIALSWWIIKLFSENNPVPQYLWMALAIVSMVLMYMSVFLLPGQGDLILTPEGLQINYFYKLWPDYRWDEFLGFYEVHRSKKNNASYRIAGELKKSVNWDKRILFPRFHEVPPQDLVAVLNQWKAKYASNHSDIEFSLEPRIQENTYSKYWDLSDASGLEYLLEPVIKVLFHAVIAVFRLIVAFIQH